MNSPIIYIKNLLEKNTTQLTIIVVQRLNYFLRQLSESLIQKTQNWTLWVHFNIKLLHSTSINKPNSPHQMQTGSACEAKSDANAKWVFKNVALPPQGTLLKVTAAGVWWQDSAPTFLPMCYWIKWEHP